MKIMKRFIKYTGILILTILVLGSCNKWIDPDINIDPDNPAEVSLKTLLPAIEARLAFTTVGGNDVARTQAIWTQQLDGIARQSLAETNYQLRSSDINNLWNAAYAGTMMDIKQLIDLAEASGAVHYRGAGKILMAVALLHTTDVWNDIPYDEAFQGDQNIRPTFNTQQEIYGTIKILLEEGIADLNATDESAFKLDEGGDYFYDGDVDMWKKAAYSYLAKRALHLSKRNGNAAYEEAMGYLNDAIADASEDFQFNYGDATKNSNPLYQFMRDREDVRMGAFFVEMLKLRFDPRLPAFVEPIMVGGEPMYVGSVPGSAADTASKPGPAIAAPDAPTYFATYMEMLFIMAECQHMTGAGDAAVRETLFMAMEESLNKYGVYSQEYVDEYMAQMAEVGGDALYKELMTQKYIALCYQSEVYNDFRRSNNVVEIPTNPNGFESEIPRRFPYSTDEITYNPNVPEGVTIMDRVWWDQ